MRRSVAAHTAGALVLAWTLSGSPAASPRPAESLIEKAFAEYSTGDFEAISRIVPRRYFQESQTKTLRKEIDDAVARWNRERRRPVQAVFLLEVARVGLVEFGELAAIEVLEKARRFVVGRVDPPGRNASEDAFEIAWHKTAVALLGGLRRPDVLENVGVAPLRRRMTAARPPDGERRLVDPWIELARAMVEEQRALADPATLGRYGTAAIQHFDEAANYEINRPEAVVRKSWLLVRMARHAEALTALDTVQGRTETTDATVQYWSWLFRGRALEGIGRPGDAARAYGEALSIMPRSQAAAAALTALEVRRGFPQVAFEWAARGLSGATGADDPWVRYGAADYRFFESRLEQLRKATQ